MVDNSRSVDIKREKLSGEAAPAGQGWGPLGTLRQEIDRLFDTHLFSATERHGWRWPFAHSEFEGAPAAVGPMLRGPAVDVVEKDEAFEITAELPGLSRDDIEIELSNSALTLKGEKNEEREEKAKGRYLSERRYGRFERVFRLPEGVDATRIDASFNKGVLKVVLPKTPEAQRQTRKVDIKEI